MWAGNGVVVEVVWAVRGRERGDGKYAVEGHAGWGWG